MHLRWCSWPWAAAANNNYMGGLICLMAARATFNRSTEIHMWVKLYLISVT